MPHKNGWNGKGLIIEVYGEIDAIEFAQINTELCELLDCRKLQFFLLNLNQVKRAQLPQIEYVKAAYVNHAASQFRNNLLGAFVDANNDDLKSDLNFYVNMCLEAGCSWEQRVF